MLAWYLLQTKARQEGRAAEHLQRQGYHCFLPQLSCERLQQGRRRVEQRPLFPGYLFIQLADTEQSWAPIRSTRGVLRLVTFGVPTPKPLPDGLVETLRLRLLMHRGEPVEPLLRSGDGVLLMEGPFAGLQAVFDCHDGEQRAVILLRCMERDQRMSVPLSLLQRR